MPELLQKFDQFYFSLINLTAKCYLSLFAHTLPEQTSLMVLDLFLLEGMHYNKVIFDITLGYLKCIERQVLACKDEEEF